MQPLTRRITPDADGNGGKCLQAHQLARHIVIGPGPVLIDINRRAQHRPRHLPGPERSSGIAGDEAAHEIGAPGDRVDHDLRSQLLGKPVGRGHRQRRPGHHHHAQGTAAHLIGNRRVDAAKVIEQAGAEAQVRHQGLPCSLEQGQIARVRRRTIEEHESCPDR